MEIQFVHISNPKTNPTFQEILGRYFISGYSVAFIDQNGQPREVYFDQNMIPTNHSLGDSVFDPSKYRIGGEYSETREGILVNVIKAIVSGSTINFKKYHPINFTPVSIAFQETMNEFEEMSRDDTEIEHEFFLLLQNLDIVGWVFLGLEIDNSIHIYDNFGVTPDYLKFIYQKVLDYARQKEMGIYIINTDKTSLLRYIAAFMGSENGYNIVHIIGQGRYNYVDAYHFIESLDCTDPNNCETELIFNNERESEAARLADESKRKRIRARLAGKSERKRVRY